MFYRSLRALVVLALRLFYRVQVNPRAIPATGPVMLVGNHPNGLVDPALVCLATERPLTFLAKAPLFAMPILGALLRAVDALPVYRRQDDPTRMNQNEGTLEAAAKALRQGGAIVIFPEGRSHSEPSLGDLKTGAARILFKASTGREDPVVVPMGLTYAEKNRFRSDVLIEVGTPIRVKDFTPASAEQEPEQVRRLTEKLAEGLRAVTLNLRAWEDLPLLATAEAFYALRRGEPLQDAERRRRFARGLALLRLEQPAMVESLRQDAASLRRRLSLVHADAEDLSLLYRRTEVTSFVVRHLVWIFLGWPFFLLGMALFILPFLAVRALDHLKQEDLDMRATVKLLATAVFAPLWLLLLVGLTWSAAGAGAGLLMAVGALPLAIFTRYFFERWRETLHDIRVFFTLGSRATLKARLLADGETLARRVEDVAETLGSRLSGVESVVHPGSAV